MGLLQPNQSAAEAIGSDWLHIDQLTAEQLQRVRPGCRGAYIDPMADLQPPEHVDIADAPVHVESGYSQMTNGQVTLSGDVEISQGPRRLAANHIFFDMESEIAELEDSVEIRQPGLLLNGTSARVNMAGNEAQFEDGEFVLHEHHLRGGASLVEQHADGVVALRRGHLTSCEPGREHWLLEGSQIKINPNTNQGSGHNLRFKVGGVPVFYIPYISFPVGADRQSGLLFPTISTNRDGLDITMPWYWNIAPNYDATIAPRYVAGHGAMLETEFRHLNPYAFNAVNLAFLPNDQGGGDPDLDTLSAQDAGVRMLEGEHRWLAHLQHQDSGTQRFSSQIDYTQVSDIDYFRDLSAASFEVGNSTYVNQSASIGYRLPNWSFQGRLQAHQNLLADVDPGYRQLPRIRAGGRYYWNKWEATLEHEYVNFTHEQPDRLTGQRMNLDYQLGWRQDWLWGFVHPTAGAQALAYRLDEDNLMAGAEPSPTLTAPYASLDTGLAFERHDARQTLEPRLFYLYRSRADHSDLYRVAESTNGQADDVNFDTTALTFGYHQLFRHRRFAGGDRIGDANQLTAGLTSRWLSESGREQVSASVGQIFYFSDRRTLLTGASDTQTTEESDLTGQISAHINPEVRIHSDFLYNPKSNQLIRSTSGLQYHDNDDRLFSVGYRFVREDRLEHASLPIDQVDTAFVWPVNPQWQVFGRLFYDLDESKELDAFIGFEYDACCYRLRLLARRWLDSKLAALVDDERRHYRNSILFEIDLIGLANSGESIHRLLQDSISGFRR